MLIRRIVRKSLSLAIFALNLLWAVPAILIIRAIAPVICIRFNAIRNERIGHFTFDSSYFLATLPGKNAKPRAFHLFWFEGKSANLQWEKMVLEHFFVARWVRILYILNAKLPGAQKHVAPTLAGSRDINGFFQGDVQRFRLTPEENAKAETWMNKRGWNSGEKFVCLLVRDSEYLLRQTKALQNNSAGIAWDYHNYRDSDIDSYSQGMRYFLSQDYWVVRLSKFAQKPVNFSHAKLIDYPFVADQNDLMDIWLSINCSLFISTGTGIDILPTVYKSPTSIFVNVLPLNCVNTWHNMTWAPKILFWKASGKLLTVSEYLEHSYPSSADYDRAGIGITDLSEKEILEIFHEHEQRLAGLWKDTSDDLKRQQKFWELFRAWPKFHSMHKFMHPQARMSVEFLRKMGDAFLK